MPGQVRVSSVTHHHQLPLLPPSTSASAPLTPPLPFPPAPALIIGANPGYIAEPNYYVQSSRTPDDLAYAAIQVAMTLISAPQAWDIATGSNR